MIANILDVDEKEIFSAIEQYEEALEILDEYDHNTLKKPKGRKAICKITYKDCVELVNKMKRQFKTNVFGVEKENGKVEGIIASIYQTVFGKDAYPTLEEKAANLLYFMIKDHPYADGCKRIAALLFIEFLNKNKALFLNKNKKLSDATLVAITLMIAESQPEEKRCNDHFSNEFAKIEYSIRFPILWYITPTIINAFLAT